MSDYVLEFQVSTLVICQLKTRRICYASLKAECYLSAEQLLSKVGSTRVCWGKQCQSVSRLKQRGDCYLHSFGCRTSQTLFDQQEGAINPGLTQGQNRGLEDNNGMKRGNLGLQRGVLPKLLLCCLLLKKMDVPGSWKLIAKKKMPK